MSKAKAKKDASEVQTFDAVILQPVIEGHRRGDIRLLDDFLVEKHKLEKGTHFRVATKQDLAVAGRG